MARLRAYALSARHGDAALVALVAQEPIAGIAG